MKLTYAEAIQFLYGLQFFGMALGLENTRKLAALAGHPERTLRFIHVAGTNGKGSTCAMLESIYRAAGLRVGLFTSPHLVAFGERIQVDRQLIPEGEVARLTAELQGLLSNFSGGAHPTFFEVVTLMALRYFSEQNCDLVIWETGLGGRLDATNIVMPLAAVITNIQLDHQQWLGDSLAQIAMEKAGIIKPGIPVVTAEDGLEALPVIAAAARAKGAPLTVVKPEDGHQPPLDSIRLPLLGDHQRLNAALALATVRVLAPTLPVSEEAQRAGLERVHWPGRLQIISRSAKQTLVLDGAHNPDGAKTLREALRQTFPGTTPTLVLGLLRDKDCAQICRILAPLAPKLLLAPVDSPRAASPEELAGVCRDANPRAVVAACSSLGDALERTAEDRLVVIAGSLHFVGQAMAWLRLSPETPADERALNDWSGPGEGVKQARPRPSP